MTKGFQTTRHLGKYWFFEEQVYSSICLFWLCISVIDRPASTRLFRASHHALTAYFSTDEKIRAWSLVSVRILTLQRSYTVFNENQLSGVFVKISQQLTEEKTIACLQKMSLKISRAYLIRSLTVFFSKFSGEGCKTYVRSILLLKHIKNVQETWQFILKKISSCKRFFIFVFLVYIFRRLDETYLT